MAVVAAALSCRHALDLLFTRRSCFDNGFLRDFTTLRLFFFFIRSSDGTLYPPSLSSPRLSSLAASF